MAAKKVKVHEKSLPKRKYEIDYVDLGDDADLIHEDACKTKMDVHMVMLHQDEEARNYVSILAHNYERVCLALSEAHKLLKEPNVAHAVDVATRIKALEEKVSRIDELERDLERHSNDYRHEYQDKYY